MSSTGRTHRRISGRLVIATHNPGKLKEMRALLAPYGIDAVAAARAARRPAFADDSGLTVDALGGEPGI